MSYGNVTEIKIAIRGQPSPRNALGRAYQKNRRLFEDHAHSDYQRFKTDVEWIFTEEFPACNPSRSPHNVLEKADIPINTLYFWKLKSRSNSEWRPLHMRNHGFRNMTFTVELAIVDEILRDYISTNRLFNSATFLTIVHLHAEEPGIDIDRTKFSTHFIHNFKKQYSRYSRLG